jgi:hypothetical protein
VECSDADAPNEWSCFQTKDLAKGQALRGLAYGYNCRVVDIVTGQKVFPCDPEEECA